MKTKLNGILLLAGVLLVVWVLASITRFLAGALLNLLLIASVVLLAVWAFNKIR